MRTPGPWEVRFYKDGRASLLASVKHDSAIVIADMVMSGHVKPDAGFIVEACNAHDALTADNARLREALEDCVTDDGAVCFKHREYLARRVSSVSDIARAALAGDCRNSCSLPSDHSGDCNAHHACPKGPGGHGGRHNMTWRKRKAGTGFYCDYCGLSENAALAGGGE